MLPNRITAAGYCAACRFVSRGLGAVVPSLKNYEALSRHTVSPHILNPEACCGRCGNGRTRTCTDGNWGDGLALSAAPAGAAEYSRDCFRWLAPPASVLD